MARFSDIPRPALVLGLGGLIPFAAGAVAVWVLPGADAAWAARIQLFYAVTILSFLGAVQWGLAIGEFGGRTPDWRWLGWSVTPSLIGWIATILHWAPALILLMAAFAATFFVDLRSVRAGFAPAWYPLLRRPLTAIAIACLGSTLLRLVTAS